MRDHNQDAGTTSGSTLILVKPSTSDLTYHIHTYIHTYRKIGVEEEVVTRN
jgi:hypothetical protein